MNIIAEKWKWLSVDYYGYRVHARRPASRRSGWQGASARVSDSAPVPPSLFDVAEHGLYRIDGNSLTLVELLGGEKVKRG